MILILVAALWIVCGMLAAGLSFAALQRGFPSIAKEDRPGDAHFAIIMFWLGPVGLFAVWLVMGSHHGLMNPLARR